MGSKVKYKGRTGLLRSALSEGYLVPLGQQPYLGCGGGSEDAAVSVGERALKHEKVQSFCLGVGERLCVEKQRSDVPPLSSKMCGIQCSCDFHFTGLLLDMTA